MPKADLPDGPVTAGPSAADASVEVSAASSPNAAESSTVADAQNQIRAAVDARIQQGAAVVPCEQFHGSKEGVRVSAARRPAAPRLRLPPQPTDLTWESTVPLSLSVSAQYVFRAGDQGLGYYSLHPERLIQVVLAPAPLPPPAFATAPSAPAQLSTPLLAGSPLPPSDATSQPSWCQQHCGPVSLAVYVAVCLVVAVVLVLFNMGRFESGRQVDGSGSGTLAAGGSASGGPI